MSAKVFSIWFCILLTAAVAWSQVVPGEKEEVIKVDTQLVEVPVVITDNTGRPVLNLKQNNFSLYEDGKPQDILEFSTTTDPF